MNVSDAEPQLRHAEIDPDALKVVRKLRSAGHEAYLVGGCVRDLYLGHKPKDFDVATSARPEQIRRLFRNSRVIGRRFKLAHIFYGPKIIETATFRAPPQDDDDDEGMISSDNVFGSVEDDARRRDFTVNGLFYDIDSGEIVDFVSGLDDLDSALIRTIGDPEVRMREDPVRMLRAVKFAARLDFGIEDQTWQAIVDVAPDIAKCSRARLLEELYKLLRGGSSRAAFALMFKANLIEPLWPEWVAAYEREGGFEDAQNAEPGSAAALLWRYLDALDRFVSTTGQTPSNGVLQAILFAPLLDVPLIEGSRAELDARIDDALSRPCAGLGVARRDRELARQIFMAHRRMLSGRMQRRRNATLPQRQYFHDALLFLGLAVGARGDGSSELDAWQALAARAATEGKNEGEGGKRRRRRRRRNKKTSDSGDKAASRPAANDG